MHIGRKRTPFLLFIGDIVAFALSLYLTLWIRYQSIPTESTIAPYLVPFLLIFALWALVFYSAGLYSKRLVLFPNRIPDVLLWSQFINILLAALFFFFVPIFGITPKTILLLYLVVSLVVIFIWRLGIYVRLSRYKSFRERVVVVAEGTDVDELVAEVNGNPRYGIELLPIPCKGEAVADRTAFAEAVEHSGAHILVVDIGYATDTGILPVIYTLSHLKHRYQFVTFENLYEDVFDRIPLSQLEHGWFLENVTLGNSFLYALIKRCIDIVGGVLMGVITFVAIPFVWIGMRLEGPGPLFITQERLGRYNSRIIAYKFRSMRQNKSASREWVVEEKDSNPITRTGAFLRLTSLDEFPQFINVLKGELSLIGPRNDILGLGTRLAEALPYYDARYLITPGITGWAQINQQYEPGNTAPQSIEETKVRLAYDFYYLKHRSLGLDIVIALKTIKRMFFRLSDGTL